MSTHQIHRSRVWGISAPVCVIVSLYHYVKDSQEVWVRGKHKRISHEKEHTREEILKLINILISESLKVNWIEHDDE